MKARKRQRIALCCIKVMPLSKWPYPLYIVGESYSWYSYKWSKKSLDWLMNRPILDTCRDLLRDLCSIADISPFYHPTQQVSLDFAWSRLCSVPGSRAWRYNFTPRFDMTRGRTLIYRMAVSISQARGEPGFGRIQFDLSFQFVGNFILATRFLYKIYFAIFMSFRYFYIRM